MKSGHARWTLLAFALLSVATVSNLLSQQQAGSRLAAKFRSAPAASERATSSVANGARSHSAKGDAEPEVSPELERAIARELKSKGYDTGGASDGAGRGQIFSAAIMAYEYDHGLPLTGRSTESLFGALVFGAPARRRDPAEQIPINHAAAEQVVRQARQHLAKLGYYAGRADGDADRSMRRAILEFERDHGLTATGRISGPLMVVLSRQAQGRR